MKKPLLLLSMIFLSVLSGCAHRQHAGWQPVLLGKEENTKLDAATVLGIARRAVADNESWVDEAEFEPPNEAPDGTWSVVVWRLPKAPGGHRVVLINEKGTVTAYLRGR